MHKVHTGSCTCREKKIGIGRGRMSRRGSRLYQVTFSLLVMLKFGRRIRYVMCECGSDVMDGPLGVELVSSFRARPIQCTFITGLILSVRVVD